MATVKLTLDKRRAKKDETFPIVFKVNYYSKQTIISTGIYVKEGAFCENLGLIPNEPQLNSKLLKLDSTYRNRFYDFILNRSDIKGINVLKNHLLNKSVEEITVYEYWQQIIRELVLKRPGLNRLISNF